MQAAAAAGNFALVLELTAEHEQRFPREQIRERLAQRVAALCALGRRSEAQALLAQHAGQTALARACRSAAP